MKQLYVIKQTELDFVWQEAAPLVEKGLCHAHGELSIDHVRLLLVQDKMKLLLSKNKDTDTLVCALVVEFVSYPNFRCANIVSIGGDNLKMDQEDITQLKKICGYYGATKIQGWTHPKMTSYLIKQGFEKQYDVVRIDI